MKKHVFLGYWFYLVGAIIFISLSIGLIAFMAVMLITVSPEVNPTITELYWGLPLYAFLAIICTYLTGYYMVQYVIVSEVGIKARCLWFTIRTLKWEDIKEVRLEKFYVSVDGAFTSGWYVFDDGVERKKIGNGVILRKKANHITLPSSKQAKKIIELYWHEPIVTKPIK